MTHLTSPAGAGSALADAVDPERGEEPRRRPETPEERAARRHDFGKVWSKVAREIAHERAQRVV